MNAPGATLRILLEQARAALGRGDKVAARRLARRAVRLDPHSEAAWLTLAAVSEPRPALAYAARALAVNPRSQPARRAIHWLVRRLPPRERPEAGRRLRLPEDLAVQLAPAEALSFRRLLSPRAAIPALGLAFGIGLWVGGQPAGGRQTHAGFAAGAQGQLSPDADRPPDSYLHAHADADVDRDADAHGDSHADHPARRL